MNNWSNAPMTSRKDTEYITELRAGDEVCLFMGMLVIANPNYPPDVIDLVGPPRELGEKRQYARITLGEPHDG